MPRSRLCRTVFLVVLIGIVRGPSLLAGSQSPPSFLPPPGTAPGPLADADAYVPQAGDLLFFNTDRLCSRCLYALAGTGKPYHVGIVVRLPDGRLAALEAGPYNCVSVYLLDLGPRLRSHEGEVWIRRLRVPLTPLQSDRLTAFALDQVGKPFALGRVCLQITPLRAHAGPGRELFATPSLERRAWFCSELAVAAASTAGLLDPARIPPNAIYPRDLFLDQPHDVSAIWEKPRQWICSP
jgi:hypothetical protein